MAKILRSFCGFFAFLLYLCTKIVDFNIHNLESFLVAFSASNAHYKKGEFFI